MAEITRKSSQKTIPSSKSSQRIEENDLTLLNNVVEFFKAKYGLTSEDVFSLVSPVSAGYDIPSCIFDNSKLSIFEAIVKYLKENKDLELKQVSELLNKGYNTVWTTYSNARKKMGDKFKIVNCVVIPISIFEDKNLTVFENVVKYLKEEAGLSNKKIGLMLHRNNKTIWTIYNRAKK